VIADRLLRKNDPSYASFATARSFDHTSDAPNSLVRWSMGAANSLAIALLIP